MMRNNDAMRKVYTKTRQPDNTEQVFIGQEEVLSIIAEDQKNREAHEKVLRMYAGDLNRYDEMMGRSEIKTLEEAIHLQELIIGRRDALRESLNSCDIPEYIGKYKERILRAEGLLERISIRVRPEGFIAGKKLVATKYHGIAEKLKEWISGADDKTMEEIIVKKRVPEGISKPKWMGSKADAHRFKHWLGTTEAPMKKCFRGLERFARDQTKGVVMELEGSIWDILKTIEK